MERTISLFTYTLKPYIGFRVLRFHFKVPTLVFFALFTAFYLEEELPPSIVFKTILDVFNTIEVGVSLVLSAFVKIFTTL